VLCRVLCALLFVAWTAEWPLPLDKILYNGYWRSPFQVFGPLFVPLPGINLFPWQVLLLALAPVCLLRPRAFRHRAWPLDVAMLTSLASIALTCVWGWAHGGSLYNAYYQLWRFLLALLVGLLLLSVLRSSRDLKALGLTVLMAALVRATLAIYFYWAIVRGRIDPPPPYMTTHDDTLLFVAGVLVTLSWALACEKWMAWLTAAPVSIYLLYAIVLNNRRLAWIELVLALAVAYLLLPRGRLHRRINRFLLVAAPVLLVYAVVGWGRQEPLFAPLRAFSTAGSNEDASSLARQEEIRNLLYTTAAAANPLLGTGWGVPYQKVTSFYANFGPEWWQYAYMPHNSLLGIAVFSGLCGIFGIWLVVPVAAFLATRGYRGAQTPVDRAGAMAALCILPAYGGQCYGDLGLQSLTCGLILGVAIGVAGKVSAWVGVTPAVVRRRRDVRATAHVWAAPAGPERAAQHES
jgi:hypothetical protein